MVGEATNPGSRGATSEIVSVPFHGDAIECIRDNGDVWVSIRRVCESLGLDVGSQLVKLKNKPWAVVAMSTTTGADGKSYAMATLHLDSVPMWLATIEPSRVAEPVRAKLVAYQVECARVLRDHFFGTTPVPAVPFAVDPVALGKEIARETVRELFPTLIAAMREDEKERRFQSSVVGKSGKQIISKAISVLAEARRPKVIDKRLYRSERAAIEMDLKARMLWSGAGSSWENFPMSRWSEMLVRLDAMAREAGRLLPQPTQLSIVPSVDNSKPAAE